MTLRHEGGSADRIARVSTTLSRSRDDLDGMPISSWIDPHNFNPNDLMRSMHRLSERGDRPEWQYTQDCWTKKDALPAADLDDGCRRFE